MYRSLNLGIATFTAIGSMTVAAAALDYSGRYNSKVTNADGSTASGRAVIARVTKNVFDIAWDIAGIKYNGRCIAGDATLNCGYVIEGSAETAVGIELFTVDEKGRLIGRWNDRRSQQVGREVLTRAE